MNYWLVHIGINLYFGSTIRFKTQTTMFLFIADLCFPLFNLHVLPKRPRSACHVVPHPWARIPLSKDHLPTANYPSPKFAWPSRPVLGSRHVNMTGIRHASIIHPVFGKCNKVFFWCKRWKNDTQTWQGEVIPLTTKGSNPFYSNMTFAKCTAVIYVFSFFDHGRHITTWMPT